MIRRRNTLEHRSVIAYMLKGETHKQAKARLDAAWQAGYHPAQVQFNQRKEKHAKGIAADCDV